MRALLGTVFFVFSVAAGAAEGKSYLCIADAATGFYFDEDDKKWKQTIYSVSSNKYVLAPSKVEGFKMGMTRVGEDFPLVNCKGDFYYVEERGPYLHCPKSEPAFYFNGENLRYELWSTIGYAGLPSEQYKEGKHPPFIEIGKCSPL